MKKAACLILSSLLFLLASGFLGSKSVYAITPSVVIGNPGQVDEGGQYSVPFSVNTDSSMTANIAISVTGGGQLAGVSASPGSINRGNIVLAGQDGVTSINGTIVFNVVSGSPVTISISGDVSSIDDFTISVVGGGTTIAVRSAAQKQADEAAAAEAARLAEESRQAAEAAAREATREQAERQASIDASIAEEQRKIQESEAIEESKRESSIAESLSEQESIREESVSIEESIAEISRSEAAESESIAESISESESEVDRTRAYEVGRDYFVPWNYLGSEGQFLFAVADTGIEAPEGYTMTDLLINRQYVWAAQSAETGARTFLVYGTYDEEVEPEFYYFDLDTHILFPYENVHSDTDNRVIRLESTEGTAETVETPTEKNSVSAGKAVLFALLGALLGAALVCLILLILKLSRERKDKKAAVSADEGLETVPAAFPDEVEKEDLPLEEDEISDPDATMNILFGIEGEEELPVTEEEIDAVSEGTEGNTDAADEELSLMETDVEDDPEHPLTEENHDTDLPETEQEIAADLPVTEEETAVELPVTEEEAVSELPITEEEEVNELPVTEEESDEGIIAETSEDLPVRDPEEDFLGSLEADGENSADDVGIISEDE